MPKSNQLRLVGLCRVSTEDQKKNTSLGTQERDIRDYCRIHGHDLIKVLSDDETGFEATKRTNFKAALQMLRDGQVDGLIVWKLDRYARNAQQGINVFRGFEKNGWQLICVKDQVDTSTAMGKAFFQLALVFSELERNQLMERSRSGWKAKKEAGRYAAGAPPYGWDAIDGALVPNKTEQTVIELIARLRGFGKSFPKIAEILNDQQTLTKTGKQWTHVQVKRVFEGPKVQNVEVA